MHTALYPTHGPADQYGGLIAGMGAFFLLFALAAVVFVIFLFWRIFTKAGMSGALAFLILIPGIGGLLVLCILAFAQWRVVPALAPYPGSYPPTYNPPAPPVASPTGPYTSR